MRLLLLSLLLVQLWGCSNGFVQKVTLPTVGDQSMVIEPRWVTRIGEGSGGLSLQLQPLLSDGTLFSVAYSGIVVAMNGHSRALKWQQQLDSHLTTSAVDGGDRIFIGSEKQIYALSKQSCEILWSVDSASEVISAPVVAGGQLLVRSINGTLVSLEQTNGTEKWRYSWQQPALTLRGESSPFVVQDQVFIGTAGGDVIALGLKRGELRWESSIAVARGRNEIERLVDVDAPMVSVDDSMLVTSAWQQGVQALQMKSGRLVWKRDFSTLSGAVLVDGTLYVVDTEGMLWALDPNSGATLWRQAALEGELLTRPVVHQDYLVIGGRSGSLHWFTRSEGKLAGSMGVESWRERFPATFEGGRFFMRFPEVHPIQSAPVTDGPWLYVTDLRGYLAAYSLPSLP